MKWLKCSMRKISWVLIITMLNLICISSNVWSAQSRLTTIEKEITQQDSNRHKLKKLFNREEMQKQLQHYGLTKEEAQNRIDALTDEEVAMAVSTFEDIPAGGIAPIIFIPIIIAINLVILIIAILWRSVDFPLMEKKYSECTYEFEIYEKEKSTEKCISPPNLTYQNTSQIN